MTNSQSVRDAVFVAEHHTTPPCSSLEESAYVK